MNNLIWTLFVQTGNIETYLLLKHIENEHAEHPYGDSHRDKGIASMETKM